MTDDVAHPHAADDANTAPAEHRQPSSYWRLGIGLIVLALLLYVYAIRQHSQVTDQGLQHPAVGRSLEQAAFIALTGASQPVRLEDLVGKVTLINYWGTWCPPCRQEFPHLVALVHELRDPPHFKFISVSVEDGLSLAQLKRKTEQFLQSGGYDVPTYCDINLANRLHLAEVAELGDRFSYPTTVILDGQLKIRGMWLAFHQQDLKIQRQLIQELLAEAGKSPASDQDDSSSSGPGG